MTSPAEAYLQDFHRRVAGATGRAFGRLPAHSGRAEYASSYDALAALVPTPDGPHTVLDLACGDGPLLKLLSDRQQASLQLVGIDMNRQELAAARAVLPSGVRLLCGRAQRLSLDTKSVDTVLSHMALGLMNDIDDVIAEIRRVLRDDGRFAAVVGRAFLLGDANEVFQQVFRPIASADSSRLPFGDRRTRSEAGWNDLLRGRFRDIAIEDIDVHWQPTAAQLWHSLTETYSIDGLSDTARETLKQRLLPALRRVQQEDGTLRTGWGLRLVTARAA